MLSKGILLRKLRLPQLNIGIPLSHSSIPSEWLRKVKKKFFFSPFTSQNPKSHFWQRKVKTLRKINTLYHRKSLIQAPIELCILADPNIKGIYIW